MISMDKKYRTRDGREVRIYAVDGGGNSPIHGAVLTGEHKMWFFWSWHKDGRHTVSYETKSDLVEVKPRIKRTVWLSLYPDCGTWISDKNLSVGDDCLARVKVEIDCEEGEGL